MIPKLIHQTWKTGSIPPQWQTWQATWQRYHPTWKYRLWTDDAIRAFLSQHYAWFIPVYDGYDENIKRANAWRYFILYHYGGVYVDLDFECLRPLDDLLAGQSLVVGLEPQAHAAEPGVRSRGLDQIVCDAFIASRPGHPFWEHVFAHLVRFQHAPGVLDAVSVFLLTRAYQTYAHPAQLTIVASDVLYPASRWDTWANDFSADALRHRVAGQAYAIHYWSGSWRREAVFKAVREQLAAHRPRRPS